MQNPIRKMNIFATPESIEALCERIEHLTGPERTVAYTYAIMMMNVCSKMVDKEIACQTLIDPLDA